MLTWSPQASLLSTSSDEMPGCPYCLVQTLTLGCRVIGSAFHEIEDSQGHLCCTCHVQLCDGECHSAR